jgi:hypothetical protein
MFASFLSFPKKSVKCLKASISKGCNFNKQTYQIIYFENLVEQKRDNFHFAMDIGM